MQCTVQQHDIIHQQRKSPNPCACAVLQEVAHAEIIRALKVEQAKELTKLRQEFELQARELGVKYDKKMKMLRDDLELRRKQEIHEIEEHKVSQFVGCITMQGDLQGGRCVEHPALHCCVTPVAVDIKPAHSVGYFCQKSCTQLLHAAGLGVGAAACVLTTNNNDLACVCVFAECTHQ